MFAIYGGGVKNCEKQNILKNITYEKFCQKLTFNMNNTFVFKSWINLNEFIFSVLDLFGLTPTPIIFYDWKYKFETEKIIYRIKEFCLFKG